MAGALDLLAAISWDPQIRGFAIFLTGIVLLPGSVYLLLATNTGAKLGLVLAITGLAGWMTIMAAVWMVFGIGLKGREAEWKALEMVTGPTSQSLLGVMEEFPEGRWEELHPGDAELADAQATADKLLAPASAEEGAGGGHGEESEPEPDPVTERFESPFSQTEDYVLLDGYKYGGENYFFTLRHRPHYVAVRVKPALFEQSPAGFKPQPDLTQPTSTVVLIRDLGSLRFPPFLVMVTSGLIFGVCCWNLHQRDKEIMRLRATAPATA
ncbi:MAG: hypothetical protein ACRD0S_01705 [Acidimicrobiales bacterium]